MGNITVPQLPSKIGTIDDSAYLHLNELAVDKKTTISQLLTKISDQYSTDIQTFLNSADKAQGRINLDIDRRTTVNDSDYTIVNTDKVVSQIGTMSAARIWSLPAASTFPAGGELILIDESGSVTSTNKITIQRDGTDTIDAATSEDVDVPYGFLRLICNGVDGWKVSIFPENVSTTAQQGVSILPEAITISNGVDIEHDITFSEGNFQFDDGSGQALSTSLTKRIDALWAAGDNTGGLDTGVVTADTTYHLFAIYNPSGISDFIFSTDLNSPSLPVGYTKKSFIESVITDGSANIMRFVQTGKQMLLFTPVLDFLGSNTNTRALHTISAPNGRVTKVLLNIHYDWITNPNSIYVSSPLTEDLAPSDTAAPLSTLYSNEGRRRSTNILVQTNLTSQIATRSSDSGGTLGIATLGWESV